MINGSISFKSSPKRDEENCGCLPAKLFKLPFNVFISPLSDLNKYNYQYHKQIDISNDDIGWLGCKLIDDIHFDYSDKFEKYFKTNLNNRRCYIKLSVDYRGNKDELISKLNKTIDELMRNTGGASFIAI